MRHNDRQYGTPFVEYTDTKANIEALTGITEGAHAYATDTHEPGWYNGSSWQWGAGGGGQYRQFLYSASGGNLTFLTDADGNPLFGLLDLE